MSVSVESQEAPALEPLLDSRWAMRRSHIGVVALFGALFVLSNVMPLRGSDLWGHVAYGKWIWQNGRLPDHDPFLPLARGMPIVDGEWLSQIALYGLDAWAGAEALSAAFALAQLATQLILARLFFLQTRRIDAMLLSLLVALAIGWSGLGSAGPESFGMLQFALLLWRILGRRKADFSSTSAAAPSWPGDWPLWVGVVAVFALWANVHGSFVCGLAVLACLAAGSALEAAWSARSLKGALADRNAQRWTLLAEAALAATLLNPYGIDLPLHMIASWRMESLRGMPEWQPLSLGTTGGVAFGLSWALLAILARHSRRRFSAADALLIGVFAAAAAASASMLGWYAAVFACVAAPHLGDALARLRAAPSLEDDRVSPTPAHDLFTLPAGRSWSYSLVCLLLIWIAFAVAPISSLALGRDPRDLAQIVDRSTPLALAEALREAPPGGLVFAPHWWSDWLVLHGPESFRPFVGARPSAVPDLVWQDYQRVLRGRRGWDSALDRYHVSTLIVDKRSQGDLVALLRQSRQWRIEREDTHSLVATRRPRTAGATIIRDSDAANDS